MSADNPALLVDHRYVDRYQEAAGAVSGVYTGLLDELGSRPGEHLLDVGCSIGLGLAAATAAGLVAEGVEPDAGARRIAAEAGYTVWESVPAVPAERRFDCIVLNHVLEHLADPVGVLTRLRALAADGGRLFIGVPSGASLWARVQRDRWCFLALDEHFWFFDPRTLRRTVEAAGWTVMSSRTSSRRYPPGALGAAKNAALGIADQLRWGECLNLVAAARR